MKTTDRVQANTAGNVNRDIERKAARRVAQAAAAPTQVITRRIGELDEEWDIERAIEANAATASLVGLTFGLLGRSRWFLLPAAVSGFLLQHAVQGWCPPIPVLRRLGFRTSFEIEQERQALKLIRGDYKSAAAGDADPEDILEAVQA